MTANGWFQIALFLALIFAVTKPLGIFMAQVFNREKTFMDVALRRSSGCSIELLASMRPTKCAGRNTRSLCFSSAWSR
jgi:K+-transporting ATPase A subunit